MLAFCVLPAAAAVGNSQIFMVGYEMLANPQRDITPEMAAAMLRAQSLERFK